MVIGVSSLLAFASHYVVKIICARQLRLDEGPDNPFVIVRQHELIERIIIP